MPYLFLQAVYLHGLGLHFYSGSFQLFSGSCGIITVLQGHLLGIFQLQCRNGSTHLISCTYMLPCLNVRI